MSSDFDFARILKFQISSRPNRHTSILRFSLHVTNGFETRGLGYVSPLHASRLCTRVGWHWNLLARIDSNPFARPLGGKMLPPSILSSVLRVVRVTWASRGHPPTMYSWTRLDCMWTVQLQPPACVSAGKNPNLSVRGGKPLQVRTYLLCLKRLISCSSRISSCITFNHDRIRIWVCCRANSG